MSAPLPHRKVFAALLGLLLLAGLLLACAIAEAEHHCGDLSCDEDHGGRR